MNLTLITHGHRIAAPMQRRNPPATAYIVRKLNAESNRVLLEPNNGSLAVWFDIVKVTACSSSQTMEAWQSGLTSWRY